MIYEPASVINSDGSWAESLNLSGDRIKWNGEIGEGSKGARLAFLAGKPGRALGIFTQIAAGWPGWLANATAELVALIPAYRTLIPCQIDVLEAMERLGSRLEAYAKFNLPVAMVVGEKSPPFNKEMAEAVAGALTIVERMILKGQGHACHTRDPEQLARTIETFADRVFKSS